MQHLPYYKAHAVVDTDMSIMIDLMLKDAINTRSIQNERIHFDFLDAYKKWILSTQMNTITGLDRFKNQTFSNGTTETFDKFYLKYHDKRIRYFKGEYIYQHVCGMDRHNFEFIEDSPIASNDVVIISLPFADTGEEHSMMKTILDECLKKNVPVLIDCAFFGVCSDIDFDLTHPAIREVSFSLSKSFPVAHLRIGARFSRDKKDSLDRMNEHSYVNRLSAAVGLKLISSYGPDYNVLKYKQKQVDLCEKLSIIASKTVIFGVDINNLYSAYNRGTNTNRLCLSNFLNA